MKSKIIISLFTATLLFSLLGCSKKELFNSEETYSIEEFGKVETAVEEKYEKETEKMNDKDKYSEKGGKVYEKASKEAGLPFNQVVNLKGSFEMSPAGNFFISSEDDKYMISAIPKDDINNDWFFIENGENITVKGTWSPDTTKFGLLAETIITEMPKVDSEYKDNIHEVLNTIDQNQSSNILLKGEIGDIVTADDFSSVQKLLYPDYEVPGIIDHKVAYIYDKSDGGFGTIYVAINEINDKKLELEKGDKIAVRGDIKSIYSLTNADETQSNMGAVMEYPEGIYKYN